MREIRVSGGRFVALVDDADYPKVAGFPWCVNDRGYAMRSLRASERDGRPRFVKMHRVITNCPEGMVVDHINFDKLDNRRSNLRVCTPQQNTWHRRGDRGSTSRFKGVSWNREEGKWLARISLNGRPKNIGFFRDEQEAAEAFDRLAREYHGEFAYLNFPVIG